MLVPLLLRLLVVVAVVMMMMAMAAAGSGGRPSCVWVDLVGWSAVGYTTSIHHSHLPQPPKNNKPINTKHTNTTNHAPTFLPPPPPKKNNSNNMIKTHLPGRFLQGPWLHPRT